jgi:hypothetical protein
LLQLLAFVEPILSFIPKSMPSFTDHGLRHSNNILTILVRFKENLKSLNPPLAFSEEEIFLLAAATFLHDIGCIVGRRKHSESSANLIINDPQFRCLSTWIRDPGLRSCLIIVIKAHSSKFDFNTISGNMIHPQVRLKLVSAVFRLMDACEISAARTPELVYEILNNNNKMRPRESKYWGCHLRIVSIVFEGTKINILHRDPSKPNVVLRHFRKDLRKINAVFKEKGFSEFEINLLEPDF